MMIAIVILGLGMLMAATMFPIGWMRARDLADFTNSSSAAAAAATTVQLLCKVSDGSATTSFLGDLDASGAAGDEFVHVLHMENMLFESDDRIGDALFEMSAVPPTFSDFIPVDPQMWSEWVNNGGLTPPVAQVAIHERVFPSLSAYPPSTAPAKAFKQWENQLLRRRFAWAVLHRMEEEPTDFDEPRSMVVYLVTLRRTQSTHRFARQDPSGTPDQPTALSSEEDVMFPVAWLVELKVLGNWDGIGAPLDPPGPRGIPSEMETNPTGIPVAKLVGQVLMAGSVLIDQERGHVYTVKQHRFTGTDNRYDELARLTVDREINIDDVDSDASTLGLEMGDDFRKFWVFPPPVARGGGDDGGFPVFDGQQPVVSIETRQMVFSP